VTNSAATALQNTKKYLVIVFAGALVSLLAWKTMSMEFRYTVAVSALVAYIALVFMFVKRLEDALIYAMAFNVCISIFVKWFMLKDSLVPARGISIGLEDALLITAYLMWFGQIFITRKKKLPKLTGLDLFVLLLVLTQIASGLLSAVDKSLALFEIFYSFKKFLLYFFIAKHVRRKHLKPIIATLIFAVFLQIGFSAYERVTGNVNIAAAKGNMASENVGSQYKVLGIENEIRVAGTTNDSHTLGLYYAMLLPLMFVLIVFKNTPRFMRLMAMLALGGGLVGLIITFSRSGWLAFAIAAMVAGGFVIFSWKRGKMVLAAVLVLFIATLFYPKGYEYVYRRVFEAPSELVTARVELMETAYELWKSSPIIGVGPGNYVEAFKAMNMVQEQALEGLPVHNSYLYTLAELGLLGFVGFFGAILLSLRSALLVHRHEPDLAKAVALGLFAGFIGYLVDGLTDPMYRELPVYMQLWFAIGLVAALRRESDAARLQDQRDSSAARVGAQMD
jgi:hypothetical protein